MAHSKCAKLSTNIVSRAVGRLGEHDRTAAFCTVCGAPWPPGARYCIRCGTPAGGADTIVLGNATHVLAGFGRRLTGNLIDTALISGPFFVATFVLTMASLTQDCTGNRTGCLEDDLGWLRSPWFVLGSQLITFLYWAFWDSLGTSLGRSMVGIKIVARDGAPPGIRRGVIRALVSQLASERVLLLGYLWALWDRERRTWHDHAAKTWAVRR